MKNDLAPKYIRSFNNTYVLWFSLSNSYSVIDQAFYDALEIYFDSVDKKDFLLEIQKKFPCSKKASNQLILRIETYLGDCNKIKKSQKLKKLPFNKDLRHIKKCYADNSFKFSVNYCSTSVQRLIHPFLSHLEISNSSNNESYNYDIHLKDNKLYLYENSIFINSYDKVDYHLLQGKFTMLIFCALYGKQEHDWLGTIHASTVTDGSSAIMCIGKSGKGKSTLTALLASNGFYLLADDISPVLTENLHIYRNLSAASIKEGSLGLFGEKLADIENLPTSKLNSAKGLVTYIPFTNRLEQNHFPCRTIISVNYIKSSKTELKTIGIKEALEILIPDTWLSPKQENANAFLNWLETVSFYEITYSEIDDIIDIFKKLFESQNNAI